MPFTYDDTACSTAEARPQGHFPTPKEQDLFVVSYFPDSPGPHYYICIAQLERIISANEFEIRLLHRAGVLGEKTTTINLDNIRDVWRGDPSSIDDKIAGQGPLVKGHSVILCLSEAVLDRVNINPDVEKFAKHPYGGDAAILAAIHASIREMKAALGAQILNLPATQAAMAMVPGLFK